MPELLRKFVLARSHRVWLLGWAISLAGLPAPSWAEPSAARTRSVCAAETDSLQRLTCYDKENASLPAPRSAQAPAPGAGAAPVSAPIPAPPPVAAKREQPVTPVAESKPTPARQDSADKEPAHLTARVLSIDSSPNEMVLHLDNGQVWQQMQQVSGDLSLRAGDTVKIDKQLGSYYLKGPHVAGMKVRLKS